MNTKIKSCYRSVVVLIYAALLNGCVAAVPVVMAVSVAAAAVAVTQVVNFARDQYPDIDFDKPAAVEMSYGGSYNQVWENVVDTLVEMQERTAVAAKDAGIIRTEKKALNDSSWIDKGLGKATFNYEFSIRVKKVKNGTHVIVYVPFWEEKMFVSSKSKDLAEGSSMMRNIFFDKLDKKSKPGKVIEISA